MMILFCRSNNINITDPPDPVKVVSDFKKAEEVEMTLIRSLRKQNNLKTADVPMDSMTGENKVKSKLIIFY